MFDIFRSQTKAAKYMLTGLLSLVALSMVTYLIPTGNGTPTSGAKMVLAEVADQKVTADQLQRAIQAQQQGQPLQPELAPIVINQLLTQYIGQLAVIAEAEKLGFKITDEELAQGIQTTVPGFFPDGKFVGADEYRQRLAQSGITVAGFEDGVRKQLLVEKMNAFALDTAVVTPKEIETEFLRLSEKVKMLLVKLDPADLRAKINPSPAELQDHYNKFRDVYMQATRRSIDFVYVDEVKVGESIPVSEPELRAAYTQRREQFMTQERFHARHILLKTEGKSDADKAKLKQKAEDLLKQARGGADFAELAKKNSDDNSAAEGGELPWYGRGATVAPFETAAFALKPKEISNVVETQFGYHIIQLLEKEDAKLKPFDDVKAELQAAVRKQQVYAKMPQLAEQARAELIKTPAAAEAIAKKLALGFVKADKVADGTPYPVIGLDRQLLSVLPQVAKGGVTEVIQLANNKLVIGVVTDILAPSPKPFSDVQSEVRTAYINDKVRDMAEKRNTDFAAKLRENNNDLEKTAQAFGLKVTTTNEFDRAGTVDGVGPATSYSDLPFTQPIGPAITYRVNGIPHYFKILSRTPAALSELPTKRSEIVTALRARKEQERREMFQEGLVKRMTDSKQIKIYDDVLKQFIASFRG